MKYLKPFENHNLPFLATLTETQIEDIINEDDLNTAMYELQGMIGEDDGGVCGMYWSEFNDSDEEWEKSSTEQRYEHIAKYLDLEDSYKKLR